MMFSIRLLPKTTNIYFINGKDLYTYGKEIEDRVRTFAKLFHVPVVGGSDTHHQLQYGAIFNVLPECETIDELKQVIQQGHYETNISPCLDTKVKAANQVKKMIKQTIVV